MSQPTPKDDLLRLLLPGEEILRDDFGNYLLIKRYNFISSLNSFQDLADLFLHVDKEWLNYVSILGVNTKEEWIVPLQLTIFCLRELRLSSEMLFCCCTTPGFSHLRSAVESFVQAQKILREPALGVVWLRKDDNSKEYDKHFKSFFKANLFP